MNINTQLQEWAEEELRIKDAQERNDELKKIIEAQVLDSEVEIRLESGPKCILTSKGVYVWESIAKSLEPDDALIEKHTETHWNKVAEEATAGDKERLKALKEQFYVAGATFAQCRVK
jgi:predicted nucleotidyltransferase